MQISPLQLVRLMVAAATNANPAASISAIYNAVESALPESATYHLTCSTEKAIALRAERAMLPHEHRRYPPF